MADPLDLDALEKAVRCPCGEPGCKAEARDETVLALIGELRTEREARERAEAALRRLRAARQDEE